MAEFSLHCVGTHGKNIVGVVVFFLVGVICWLGKNMVVSYLVRLVLVG